MEFREFVKLYEKIQTRSNPRGGDIGTMPPGWAPLGMVIPTGSFGALPTQWTGSQQGDEPLYSGGYMGTNWVNGKFDIGLPTVSRTSKISNIKRRPNVITIYLDDTTKLDLPPGLFKRLNVEPEVGRTIMVTFQRRKDDGTVSYSKIQSLKCL